MGIRVAVKRYDARRTPLHLQCRTLNSGTKRCTERMIVVWTRERSRSAIISTKSRSLNLKRKYHRTHRMMISRSKCRPLNSCSERVPFFAIPKPYLAVLQNTRYPKFAPEPPRARDRLVLAGWGWVGRSRDRVRLSPPGRDRRSSRPSRPGGNSRGHVQRRACSWLNGARDR